MAEKKIEQKKEIQELKGDIEDLQVYIDDFASFLPIAICDITTIGIIIFINKAFQKLTGYLEIDVNGEHVETIFLEKKKTRRILDQALKKKVVKSAELTLISKTNKEIPVGIACSAREDKDGNIAGYFLSIADIRESKKLRKELEGKVRKRTKELQERVEELERVHKLIIGRELRMVEMKTRIAELEEELKRYKD